MNTIADQPAVRVTTDRSVARVLDDVEQVLRQRGWTQGVLEQNTGGPVCSVGAVLVAVAGPGGITAWSDGILDDAEAALVDDALDALARAIGVPENHFGPIYIEDWNDATGRTFDEVLAVIRKARKLAGGRS